MPNGATVRHGHDFRDRDHHDHHHQGHDHQGHDHQGHDHQGHDHESPGNGDGRGERGQAHHHHGPRSAGAAAPARTAALVPSSLLRLSAVARLSVAVSALLVLWSGVYWVLG